MATSKEPAIPQLGMAGAAFAALLIALTLPTSALVLSAIRCFAVAMPLVVGGVLLRSISSRIESSGLSLALDLLWQLVGNIGELVAAVGIYWLLRNASPPAAGNFLALSLLLWFAAGFLDLGLRLRDGYVRGKRALLERRSNPV